MVCSFCFFSHLPELEPIIFVIQRVNKILYSKAFLHRDTFNPGEKSVGQYCYIHIFAVISRFPLKTVHPFRNFLAVLPPPTLYGVENSEKKFWIHASNIACGV